MRFINQICANRMYIVTRCSCFRNVVGYAKFDFCVNSNRSRSQRAAPRALSVVLCNVEEVEFLLFCVNGCQTIERCYWFSFRNVCINIVVVFVVFFRDGYPFVSCFLFV